MGRVDRQILAACIATAPKGSSKGALIAIAFELYDAVMAEVARRDKAANAL